MNRNRTDSVWVTGNTPLKGVVNTQGSKNAALPMLAAIPLIPEVELYNVPDLSDIHAMIGMLKHLGAEGSFENGVLRLNTSRLQNKPLHEDWANQLRASSLFMGSLLGRFGEADVGLPGGCVIGNRQLDIHYKGFEALGATVRTDSGHVRLRGPERQGEFALSFPSVGATQNLISSAVLGEGETILHNIATEPEVVDFIHYLNAAGADIRFIHPASVHVKGVASLRPVKYRVQADRIEAITLLVAGFATKGDVTVKNCDPSHISYPLQILGDMGASVKVTENSVRVAYKGEIRGTTLKTDVYPGFPTDMQAQFSVLMTQASEASMLTEDIFNNRFNHLDELSKMNAEIDIAGNTAMIKPSRLSGCRVESYDLRGAASMIIAGLVADGVTSVNSLNYLYRGYEDFIGKLSYLGADVTYK